MKQILILLLALLITDITFAQIPPQAFSYSGVARDALGNPIATQTIGVQLSIIKTSLTGTAVYMENHFANTDALGLFNLTVGTGAVQSGTFATIDWSNDNYYLKVGMDAIGGTNFAVMGTTQLLSVPYALYAKSAGSVSGGNTPNGFDIKFSGVSISDTSLNFATMDGYIYYTRTNYFFLAGRGTNTFLDANNKFVTDTITNNPIYIITGSSQDERGQIGSVILRGINNLYYVPLGNNAVNVSNLYYYNSTTNRYNFYNLGAPIDCFQMLPNNPSVTGFNLTLPINVTIERQ